jgi:hypothetical protein
LGLKQSEGKIMPFGAFALYGFNLLPALVSVSQSVVASAFAKMAARKKESEV